MNTVSFHILTLYLGICWISWLALIVFVVLDFLCKWSIFPWNSDCKVINLLLSPSHILTKNHLSQVHNLLDAFSFFQVTESRTFCEWVTIMQHTLPFFQSSMTFFQLCIKVSHCLCPKATSHISSFHYGRNSIFRYQLFYQSVLGA